VRVLIVDDEPAARRRLAVMLEELDVEVAGEAANGVQALELAARLRPDVLLLDIQMREVSGLDVARHLPEPRPLVIFQTAHAGYAVEAFEAEALDFVLKPVTLDRLRAALDRARRRLEEAARPTLTAEMIERLQSVLGRATPAAPSRLLVRDGGGHRLVPLREIVRASAGEGVVHVHTAAGRFLADYTLGELEARGEGSFVRASRADLVSLAHVRRFVPSPDGSAAITLADGATVRVSRRRAPAVRRALEG
jgi:two-component system LytT family response regulator